MPSGAQIATIRRRAALMIVLVRGGLFGGARFDFGLPAVFEREPAVQHLDAEVILLVDHQADVLFATDPDAA